MHKANKIILVLNLLFFISTLCNPLTAQIKEAAKVERFFLKGNYNRCIKKSIKFADKYPKNAEFIFFKTLSYFELLKKNDSDIEKKQLEKKIISGLLKVKKQNLNYEQYAAYDNSIDSIHVYLKETADKFYENNKVKSKFYYDNLALLFNDTSKNYYVFHVVKNNTTNKEGVQYKTTNINSALLRNEMLSKIANVVGTKYVYGGETPVGFDCSGFTKYAYAQIGINLPHNAQMQSVLGVKVEVKDAEPGDLIFFGSFNNNGSYHAVHAGIVYDNNNAGIELIHCVSGGVSIDDSEDTNNKYWLQRAIFAKRIIGEDSCKSLCGIIK